jgi:hypothetical protein
MDDETEFANDNVLLASRRKHQRSGGFEFCYVNDRLIGSYLTYNKFAMISFFVHFKSNGISWEQKMRFTIGTPLK